MSAGSAAPAVELRGISKRFGDLVANDGVDLTVAGGEIHALLGENGAGKTTLMRILYGLTVPDAGEVRIAGQQVRIRSPADAISAGIGMVTQHFSLVRPMTVAENLALGRPGGLRLDRRAAEARVRADCDRFGMRIDPRARVDGLSVGEQQRVEILKALSRDCRVLILDEPTAVLVPQEVEALFATLRRLAADGMAVVFISHKLREVLAITDRVTVLRRGALAGSSRTAETNEQALASMMVGAPAADPIASGALAASAGSAAASAASAARSAPAMAAGRREPALRVEDLSARGAQGLPALRSISFEIAPGEILGVAGVSGNGQSELVEILSGTSPPDAGSMRVAGRELAGRGVKQVIGAGVGRIPEDRHASVVSDLSVAYNLVLERLDDFRKAGRLDESAISRHAAALIERFDIRARPRDPVGTLSGGNIQKVILARVLSREPLVLIVSQPTRGLDVGATVYVREQLRAQRQRGAAILLVSEDLDELLALTDRLIVLYEGRVVGEMPTAGADVSRLGLLMAGRAGAAAA
jgi:simple sugar transport system ATP-binding protein